MKADLRRLVLLPSFHGAVAWAIWLPLYWLRLVRWDAPSLESTLLFAFVLTAFVVSLRVHAPRLDVVPDAPPLAPPREVALLLALHALGLAGIAKYVLDFSARLGGPLGFALLLVSEPHRIRWETEVTQSIGTQVSYLGWLAIALTVVAVRARRVPRAFLWLAVVQFIANLTFIDRTRPLWILVTCALPLLPGSDIRPGKLLRQLALGGAALLAVFIALGVWIGKIDLENTQYGGVLPPGLESVYVYGTAGFAYFDRVLRTEPFFDYLPLRTAYPLVRILASLGLSPEPPSQVLEFLTVPFETNVGTLLEPLWRDGGLPYAIAGTLVYSFGFDALALWLWRRRSPLASFAAANLCFAALISFFTPKLSSFPLWLFIAIGLLARRHSTSK